MPADELGEYQSATVIYLPPRFGGTKPPGPPLDPPGGGGGTFDGMEPRVARLEADVGHLKENVSQLKNDVRAIGKDVKDLRVQLSTLTERMTHLPSKAYIGWWISGGVTAAIAGLTLLSKLGWLVAGVPK